ncbi:hypothetical protein [Micromonospora sp. LOL_021]|uniref:hypothetical protein n=1 Tax=Micromonospora sp. LOL_021 TaxID=3345417 RepID=UPI003A86510A
MKTLPDNPHLDHLRQQAKELLAGLRDVDPAATLADAATGLGNYIYEQVEAALAAGTTEEQRYADRSVRHLLAHLPTRTTLERLLDAVA